MHTSETDSGFNPPKRRMSDHKIEAYTNSSLVKLLTHIITVVGLPLLAWFATGLMQEMKEIKQQMSIYQVDKATTELRMLRSENSHSDIEKRVRAIEQAVLELQLEMRMIKTRQIFAK
jgi:hypothetical protein